jgi:threonine aldolase
VPELIDLRSDTVTRPTPEMRRAMAEAEVGDDVFGDDPTVMALEARAAELTGKEAALFVASGTMGNLVAHMSHVPRGGEIIAPADAHVVLDEAAGHAVITGASVRQIPASEDGTMDPAAIREAFRDPDDVHEPLSALVIVENTHAQSMGQPLSAAYIREVAAIAHARGVPLHVDGARLFNAAVALGTTARELLEAADSATFCLSKGLCCPVGSVVVGSTDFIRRARRARKLVGGGMRQVGVLAAPGLVALRDGASGMIERLAEDHARASRLAEGISDLPGIVDLDPARVRTNFVIFRLRRDADARTGDAAWTGDARGGDAGDGHAEPSDGRAAFLERLAQDGILMVPFPGRRIRAVTHHGIEDHHIDRVIAGVARAVEAIGT